jgi:recombination protein RecT
MTELETALEARADREQAPTVVDLLERMKPQLERMSVDGERLTRIVLTELRRTPKLYECSPQSLIGAMMLAGQLGLEPGPLGHVYFVPFKGEITFVLGYRGIIDLGYRSGLLKSICAVTVREGDEFYYRQGTRPVLDHVPAGSPEGRNPVAYYSVGALKTGGSPFVVLYPEDVESTKAKSPGSSHPLSPWNTHFDAMARKTAVRRLAPMLPQSPVFAQAMVSDGQPVTLDEDTMQIEIESGND